MSATFGSPRDLVRALRPLHWSKNFLVFAPLALNHHLNDPARLSGAILGFLAFCAAASGTYLINDCRDVEADRLHPKKRNRPLASGAIGATFALALGIVLSGAAIAIGLLVGISFAAYVVGYLVLTLSYSLALKRLPLIDVLVLSALYGIRVIAGGVAASVEVSDWLLALCAFLFFSLAMLKRYADLRLHAIGGDEPAGRGYLVGDADLLRTFGVAAGMTSVLVFALYLTSPQVAHFYRSPRLLWLVCPPLLYWIAHMWLLAQRGKVEDDPLIVAATEPASWVVAVLIAAIAFIAV